MNKIEHHLPLEVSSRDAQSVVTCHGYHLAQVQYDCAENHNQEFNAEVATFIVTACNEHAALLAVAEAARNLPLFFLKFLEEIGCDGNSIELTNALATLAQIRGGGK